MVLKRLSIVYQSISTHRGRYIKVPTIYQRHLGPPTFPTYLLHQRQESSQSPVLTMKEAIVHPGPRVEIVDSSVPQPNADQVLTKVVVSGTNPKDWKRPDFTKRPHNSGDDVAGIIEKVGDNVTEFKAGDRVAAFHEMMSPHGSFAEYAIAWAYTTFHLPKNISFEEAATIPLAAMTAAIGLCMRLKLPEPWHATRIPTPLIIYGASGAVGAFAIKLAQASNIHPIIAVAGNGEVYVEKLINRSKGDTIVDYRKGNEAIVSGIKEALKKAEQSGVKYAFDAVSEKNSYQNIREVLSNDGKITLVLPGKDYKEIPQSIEKSLTTVGSSHIGITADSPEGKAGIKTGAKEFAYVFFRLFTKGLQDGWFAPHPYQVIPGGLKGVEEGLTNLKAGKASAVKYVYKIEDTE